MGPGILIQPLIEITSAGFMTFADWFQATIVTGAVSIALRSVLTDFVSDLTVDLGWVSGSYGKWFKTALQALIILESFATGLVITIFRMIIAFIIKKTVGGFIGGASKMIGGVA